VPYIGMLALGGFVGVVVTGGLRFITATTLVKIVATILGAVFGGVVLRFLNNTGKPADGYALAGYPIGLMVASFWVYANVLSGMVADPTLSTRITGIAGLLGIIVATGFALYLATPSGRKTFGA
jgi:hypothetical protein